MTISATLSENNLKDRRKQRRKQRDGKLLLTLWRFVFLSGMTLSILYFMRLPLWLIYNSSNIEIHGNQQLSKDQILSWLKLSYPQAIWRLPVDKFRKELQEIPPLGFVAITRQVLPTKLIINIREREPLAIANTLQGVGFLDNEGYWIDKNYYPKQNTNLPLKVINYSDKYRPDWSNLYNLVINSQIKIKTIDWSNPSNLILQTELGTVHFGAYSIKDFAQKLIVLNKLKSLSTRLPSSRISYIDLSNPDKPSVQVVPPSPSPSPSPTESKSTNNQQ